MGEEKNIKKIVLQVIKSIILSILLIFLICVLFILIYVARNFFILKSLSSKSQIYQNSQNYHIEVIGDYNGGFSRDMGYDKFYFKHIFNYYKKLDKTSMIRKEYSPLAKPQSHQYAFYFNNSVQGNCYCTSYPSGEKTVETADYNESLHYFLEPLNINIAEIYYNNAKEEAWRLLVLPIESIEYQGKKCYKIIMTPSLISDLFLGDNISFKDISFIVEKATGLPIKAELGYQKYEYKYEFDNVDDSVFIEPNIEEYRNIDDEIKIKG